MYLNRCLDVGKQDLMSDIATMDRLRTYNLIKTDFGIESYLINIKQGWLRALLAKFRGGLLDLRGNSGRYDSTPLFERVCPLCNADVELEYHFLLLCPAFDRSPDKACSACLQTSFHV